VSPLGTTPPLRVLIAGGGGGVGIVCAAALAEHGAELILCDIDGMGLTDAAEELGAFTRYCDAIDENSVAIFAAEIAEKFPSIDVLINATGRGYVRSLGMMRMTRAFMPLLRKARGRRLLINIAPAGGFLSHNGMFPYSSSRRSFNALCEAIREQARGTSIDVVNITPRLLRGRDANECDRGGLYRLERVDARDTARRVVELIDTACRSGTRMHPPPHGGKRARPT
jgi:NADP-dependent 3-hydroxy acid dehydrogenase YdfG